MAKPGVYVAHHPWLGPLFKVGHSGDLRGRLADDAYTTCFVPGWEYLVAAETRTKGDAARLEGGVLLAAARVRRPNGTHMELVATPLPELRQIVIEVARVLGVEIVLRERPVYPPKPTRKAAPVDSVALITPAETDAIKAISGEMSAAGGETKATAETRAGEATPDPAFDDGEDAPADELDEIPAEPAPPSHPLVERAYQTEAIAACLAELDRDGRCVLQMACRCGKTRVAHGVVLRHLAGPARVLYLVPGLALLRQTVEKLEGYGLPPDVRLLLVGSTPLPVGRRRRLATTDPAAIAAAVAGDGPLLVVSTYQSSPLLPDAFSLTVFDEAHRVCGSGLNGADEAGVRPMAHVLLRHTQGLRLFMTATPAYDGAVSMRDRALFGGVAYAYHLRRGIDAGYVSDFSLDLVGGGAGGGGSDGEDARRAAQVAAAFRQMAPGPAGAKLLVFCRSIAHALRLRDRTEKEFGAEGGGEAPPLCLAAHSRLPPGGVAAALRRFAAPGPAVLFNCRLFQEGVEIPELGGVFFAAPRHSPRDVIQSLCRPLNKLPGKPAARVFLPVDVPGSGPAAPEALAAFATIVPFFDALAAEDPTLYEHLLDPEGSPYPLRWVDGAAGFRYDPRACLAAARRVVRRGASGKTERLLRAARVPWEIGFGELARVVRECGRYPKTTDCFAYGEAVVPFGNFYHYVREAYAGWRAGGADSGAAQCPLEPFQLRALETLPGWDPYGVEGPYPWAQCLAFLEEWLQAHGGVPPMLEINVGGYVGLEATPMERLSGALTCINQGDGRDRAARPGSGMTVDPQKQADLDALCARWGLRWRKDRAPDGALVADEKGAYAGRPTFIQEAFARFKAEWAAAGDASPYVREWFPGYPHKHRRQERPDVWAKRAEVVPPRRRAARKA